jgi:hypothetical protein
MKIIAKIFTVALLLIATFVAQAQRPSIWTVTNAGDGAAGTISGAGTLRNTIAAAASGDIITFSPSLNNVTILLNSTVAINKSITIMGNGNHLNRIQLNNITTGSVFTVTNSTQFSMLDVTVANGANALTIDTGGEISLSGCVFNSRVDIYSPQLLYVYKCDFRSILAGLRLISVGTRQPLLGANSYFIANSTFDNNNNGTLNLSNALSMSSTLPNAFPVNLRVSDCNFTNNLTDFGCLDYAIKAIDSIKVTGCRFDNNRLRTNIQGGTLPNASTIIGRGGNILVMNSFFRGNTEGNNVSTCNLIVIRNDGSIALLQNQITGNNGAGIRIVNSGADPSSSTGGVMVCRQNSIANNNNAVIVANSLQVANSYLETAFNVTNPVSLGGNYFANPPSWAINSDILPSPTTTLNPFFVAPITSLLPVQTIPTTAGNYRLAANSILIGRAVSNQVPQDIFDYDGDGNITEIVPFDIVGNPRHFNRGVDIGAYERQSNGGGLRTENTEETLANNAQTVIYPNPANEVLNINFELSTGADKAEVAIFNTIGQVVYQTTVNADNKAMKVDVRNFDKGLYVIKIVDNQGNAQNQKVLVQ